MLAIDREQFDNALAKLMGLFNRTLEAEQRDIWWAALKAYDLLLVRAAMLRYSQEKFHAPVPANIRMICADLKPVDVEKFPQGDARTFWDAVDLLTACEMAAINWSNTRFPEPKDWADRAAKSYDAELAETAMRIVARHADKSPSDAARAHLKEHPNWRQEKQAHLRAAA